ncbi:MAG: YitT family protein [Clostridiaceae bacterium]|nr:YitT family protein [Clostridiaceae bacterium]
MKSVKTGPKLMMLKDYGMIIIGSILYVLGLKIFIAPMHIPTGGIAGIALLGNYIWGLPIGIVTMVLNIPLLFFGYKILGKDFFFKTLFMTVFSSVLIDLSSFLPVYNGDILLASLFGGIIKGFGFGLIIRSGGTSGGTDVIGKYLYRKRAIPLGTTGMTINVFVMLLSAIMLKSLESLLYGIIMSYAVSVVMDSIIYGGDVQKNALIITSKPDEVASEIMSVLHHGVTGLDGKGMYTGKERMVLMCVVRRHEITTLKKLILEIDEGAFMMLSDVSEVFGRGFKRISLD